MSVVAYVLLTVGVFADDAHRLLAAVTPEPAFVLGSSGGASYGLDLVARYPEQVRTLVAHEPPVAALLPDAAHWRAFTEEIRDIYQRDGVFPANTIIFPDLAFAVTALLAGD